MRTRTLSKSELAHIRASFVKEKPSGVGDLIERVFKPIAVAAQKLKLIDCLNQDKTLKAGSPCAKRRDKLNTLLKSHVS